MLKSHSEPLPRSNDGVIALFKRVLQLSAVTEIKVTVDEFSVTRDIEDGVVLPPLGELMQDADAEFILTRIADNLETMGSPASHPYFVLVAATAMVSQDRRKVCAILAPRGTLLADYFGLPDAPEVFLGIPVIYHDLEDKYPDKIVVFGGPTIYFNDATHGVIIDTGT